MSQRAKLISYISLVIIIFGLIFLVWAYDTGRFFSHADTNVSILSSNQLTTLPAPDQSTFGNIFGKIVGWFAQ